MVFKWFNVMIKTRQKCGANSETMQINEKYSVRSETKRSRKEINAQYSRLRNHQKSTTHDYFLCLVEFSARVFTCPFWFPSHRYSRHNLLRFETSTNMFEVMLVGPLEPTKEGTRDKWKTFSVNFALFFLSFCAIPFQIKWKKNRITYKLIVHKTHIHPINHLLARANISRHNFYADLHVFYFVLFS